MTEQVDFTALLPLGPPLPSGALPPPSPPPPDLEAMASHTPEGAGAGGRLLPRCPSAPTILPTSLPPPLPPPPRRRRHRHVPLPLPLPHTTFDLPQPPSLDTLDLLAIPTAAVRLGRGTQGLAPPPNLRKPRPTPPRPLPKSCCQPRGPQAEEARPEQVPRL